VAEDAYRKLQNDPNVKIYVIKYKTKAATGLDSCAANIYSVNSEDELTDQLKKIAEDIKLFAKYRDALVKEDLYRDALVKEDPYHNAPVDENQNLDAPVDENQ
ncbi:MAG: hypothetical protein LBG04_02450, partial [Holosporaceae bacterium]|nr:hypothetical protein [Holosporaceae bacterium]